MRNILLAYLLDDLSAEERNGVEEKIREDPQWQAELKRLQECMPQDEESDSETPSVDLADRTCSLIRSSIDNQLSPEERASIASLSESVETQSHPCRWSFADLVVGGGVLVVLAMLVLPAVRESRDAARRSACQNKLRALGAALTEFADQRNGQLPQVDPGENAGIFVFKMAESGGILRQQLENLLVCPESPLAEEVSAGRVVIHIPSQQELAEARGAHRREILKRMSGSYAVRIGYRDNQGAYRQLKFTGRGDSPLLADEPSFEVVGFQSVNHGGCGQNVLFQDQSVRYCNECGTSQSKDHLFLNAEGQHAAGSYRADVVLGRSETVPNSLQPISSK